MIQSTMKRERRLLRKADRRPTSKASVERCFGPNSGMRKRVPGRAKPITKTNWSTLKPEPVKAPALHKLFPGVRL
jgi:hypothetical protein